MISRKFDLFQTPAIIQMMMRMIKMMHLRWWLVGIQYNSMNNPGLVRQGGRSSSHLCNSHTYLLTLILPSSKYISNKKNTNQNKENTKTNKKNTNPNKKNTKTKKKNAHNPHSLLISTSIPVFPPIIISIQFSQLTFSLSDLLME